MLASTKTEDLLANTIEKFWETIPPVWNTIRGNVRCIATDEFGISVEQFHILRHIRRGMHSASELASINQISRPAISQAVDLLVEKGLVARTQGARDRRYVRLDLTPEGDRLLNAIFDQNRAWMKTKMAALTPADHDTILRALTLLKETFLASNP
jgi:DNA-binding MarR family transcriptional regulator